MRLLFRSLSIIISSLAILTVSTNLYGAEKASPKKAASDIKAKPEEQLKRIKYNNPGLVVDLGVGLWCWPVPMDVNGDGHLDLVVDCEDTPYNGVYYFENTGNDKKFPIFKASKRISSGKINVQPSFVNGKVRVLTPGFEYPDYGKSGLAKPVAIKGVPANVHFNGVRGNMWRYTDFNGDGKLDLVIGTDDWKDYGWDNAWTKDGVWKNGQIHGNIYVVLNKGSNENPEYAKPYMLLDENGNKLETYGWPSPSFADWDGDGDLDIVVGQFMERISYIENIGTRTEPKYKKVEPLYFEDGTYVAMDLAMITPHAFDWDSDGDLDLIVGDEDGRVAFIENTGKLKDNKPLFLKPYYFKQEADEVKCGALSTPWAIDWDKDGDLDIICGNSAGYIVFYENLSGAGVEKPKWAQPVFIESNGKIFRVKAGPNGSIQGPCERQWGYTTLSVIDWDKDGHLDIVYNSIWGKVCWLKNKGTSKIAMEAPQPIEVEWKGPQPRLAWGWVEPEGKALLTQWRTTPVTCDWNQDGLPDLLMLDQEGFFSFFERKEVAGKLVLLPPKRIFCNIVNKKPLQLNANKGGGSGRRKICVGDFNADGKMDILVNSTNANLMLQEKAENGLYYFRDKGPIDTKRLAGHTSSPTAVDFNKDGITDFLIGAEDGYLYYMKNK